MGVVGGSRPLQVSSLGCFFNGLFRGLGGFGFGV